MAKKSMKLDFLDIVMGADAQTIKEAYEARVKVDDQLILRDEAYQKIAQIEAEVEQIIGKEGQFVFPAPPLPIAGYSRLIPASKPAPKVERNEPEAKPISSSVDLPPKVSKAPNGGTKSSAIK